MLRLHPRFCTIFGITSFLFAFAIESLSARAADVPRYKLPIGRVLEYTASAKSAENQYKTVWRIIVVGTNARDGSSRIVVRALMDIGNDKKQSVGSFDVMPDGELKFVSTFSSRSSPDVVFPVLPANEQQASSSWTSPPLWSGSTTTYKPASSGKPSQFVFAGVEHSPVGDIYEMTEENSITFDREKGVVVKSRGQETQNYGLKQTMAQTLTLDKDETIDAAKAAALGKEYEIFFDAESKATAIMERLYDEPQHVESILADAKAAYIGAAKNVHNPEVANQFAKAIKEQKMGDDLTRDDAKRTAEMLNQPAKDWTATDLDGKSWRLKDLKGKVVVMDFWYRGCGWCMYAMPQVKQLAADYKDKPVVVLGMNTDQNEEDARFVIKTLGLTYPQVKATGIPERFGVQGFPTLIVVDQAGVVRKIHVGYHHDLRERIGKKIDDLLAQKAPQ